MKCEGYDKLLAERLAGDLPLPDRARLERHLKSCSPCRARAGGYDDLGRELRSLRDVLDRVSPPLTFMPGEGPGMAVRPEPPRALPNGRVSDRTLPYGRVSVGHHVRRRIFVMAQALLATAAAIVLVLVGLQHAPVVHAPVERDHTLPHGRVSDGQSAFRVPHSAFRIYALPYGRVSVASFRTAPVWLGGDEFNRAGEWFVARVPSVTMLPIHAKLSSMGASFKTPSLILKPRSHSHVDDSKNERDGAVAPADHSSSGGEPGSGTQTA